MIKRSPNETMTRSDLLLFMRGYRYAALVGIAVSDDLEIIFEGGERTVKNAR
jgi:hypothetical protein